MSYLLFDIGGSKMRFAVTDDCIACTEPIIVKTPDTYEDALKLVEEIACTMGKYTHALGGVAGAFGKDRDTLLISPNNPDWVGKPLKKDFQDRLGVPVEIENDTAVISLGEALVGAGKGADIVGYMTVSTGVGGSRVVDGVMDRKAQSFEPGHQIIGQETLENLVSGTAVKKRFGKEAYEIEDAEIWTQVTKELAIGVHNTLLHWSPDILVLGGSMITGTTGPCINIDELTKEVVQLAPDLHKECVIKKAQLGDLNGIYGALEWAKQLFD